MGIYNFAVDRKQGLYHDFTRIVCIYLLLVIMSLFIFTRNIYTYRNIYEGKVKLDDTPSNKPSIFIFFQMNPSRINDGYNLNVPNFLQ